MRESFTNDFICVSVRTVAGMMSCGKSASVPTDCENFSRKNDASAPVTGGGGRALFVSSLREPGGCGCHVPIVRGVLHSFNGADVIMYNSRMKDTRGFLAIIMALVMVFAGVAFIAAEVSALDEGEAVNPVSDTKWYSETKNSFVINTEAELRGLAELVNAGNDFSGKTVALGDNIDLKDVEWTPIGTSNEPFNGTFDGKNKVISNLMIGSVKVEGESQDYKGLFGATGVATIKDLTITNVQVFGGKNVGAIVGGTAGNATTIQNCTVNGDVNIAGVYKVGGIIGGTYVTITNCTVSSEDGIIQGNPVISKETGAIVENFEGDNVGGIIGYLGESGKYKVDSCTVDIDVSGTRKVGGIVGSTYTDRTISNCTYSGTLAIDESVPDNYKSTLSVGGILGEMMPYKNNDNFVFTGNNADGAVLNVSAEDSRIKANKLIGFGRDSASTLVNSINNLTIKGYYMGTYNGVTALILEGYNGNGVFTEDVTGYEYVVVYGANVVKAGSSVDTVFSGGNLTILGADDDAKLTITGGDTNTIVIQATGNLKVESLELIINGKNNRALYSFNDIVIDDSIVTVDSSEKAIRAANGVVSIEGESTVTATIIGDSSNDQGLDDFFGIKAPVVTINAGSKVTTEGIHMGHGVSDDKSVNNISGTLVIKYDAKEGVPADKSEVKAFRAGLVADTPIFISSTTSITIEKGVGIYASFENEDNKVQIGMKVPGSDSSTIIPVYALADVTVEFGSVRVSGGFTYDDSNGTVSIEENLITISGDVKISGTVDVPVKVEAGAVVTVPKGEVLTLNQDMILEGKAGETTTINVYGSVGGDSVIKVSDTTDNEGFNVVVVAEDTAAAEDVLDESVTEKTDVQPTPADETLLNRDITVEDVRKQLKEFNRVAINRPLTIQNDELTIENGETLILKTGAYIVVEKPVATGADDYGLTIDGSITGEGYILVKGYLALISADVRVPVIQAADDAYISVSGAKTMTVTGDQNTDLSVGYGNTLVLSGLTVYKNQSIDAYGNVIIEGNVRLASGAVFNIYAGGNAQIDGTLNVEGDVNVYGTMDVTGAVKVYDKNGGAEVNTLVTDINDTILTEDPTGTIAIAGTMDVLKAGNNATQDNILRADVGKVAVEGTLTITGTLSGKVADMGTIVFNGTAMSGSEITVFDGVTLTIASVKGTLDVTDKKIIDTDDLEGINYAISASETVTLKDIKGVTISVAVKETVKEVNETVGKYRFYVATMTVSGSVVDTDTKDSENSKMTISNDSKNDQNKDNASFSWPSSVSKSGVVVNDITVGEKVAIEFDAKKVSVNGTVSVVAKDSSITTKQFVTVNGTIIVGDADGIVSMPDVLKVNGAHYKVQSEDMTEYTDYYTAFATAIAATDIYENKVDLLGKATVKTEVEIPAGIEVIMAEGSTLEISVDGVLTVAATALLDGSDAAITVKGMLVIADKDTGFEAPTTTGNFKYQVKTETEESITYCGLILAIRNAQAGDVIEIVGTDAVIEESVIIPEGVTLLVPQKAALTIGDDEDKVVLTVKGTLKVTQGTIAIKANSETEVVVDGVVAINGLSENNTNYTNVKNVSDDFVMFEMKVDGKYVTVMSNIAYAAENAVEGKVTVFGDVSGGDVTFTQKDKPLENLIINVDKGATLSVSSMTLVGATLKVGATVVADKAPYFSGTVKAAAADGVSEIEAVKACNFTIASGIEEDVDGKTDVMYVAGIPMGEFTLASGTITVTDVDYTFGSLTIGGFLAFEVKDLKTSVSVESGVTLVVPKDVSFGTVAFVDENVVIAGDIIVKEGANVGLFGAIVSGQVTVEPGADVDIGTMGDDFASTVVTGTISAAAEADGKDAGVINVVNNMFLGTAPVIGSTGTISGDVNLGSSYIIAYPGSDLSGALIDVVEATGESDAESTEYYINGELYMTVYTTEGYETVAGFTNDLDIEIPGLVTPTFAAAANASGTPWFSDEEMKTPYYGYAVGVDKLYTEFETATVKATISAGIGLQIYIDGLSADNYQVYGDYGSEYKLTVGTHTVSIETLTGYDGSNATITVNGKAVSNGGSFTIDVDEEEIVIIASGAVPAQSGAVIVDNADEGMSLTDILLIVLVVLIVIMAIIVALRMMRS